MLQLLQNAHVPALHSRICHLCRQAHDKHPRVLTTALKRPLLAVRQPNRRWRLPHGVAGHALQRCRDGSVVLVLRQHRTVERSVAGVVTAGAHEAARHHVGDKVCVCTCAPRALCHAVPLHLRRRCVVQWERNQRHPPLLLVGPLQRGHPGQVPGKGVDVFAQLLPLLTAPLRPQRLQQQQPVLLHHRGHAHPLAKQRAQDIAAQHIVVASHQRLRHQPDARAKHRQAHHDIASVLGNHGVVAGNDPCDIGDKLRAPCKRAIGSQERQRKPIGKHAWHYSVLVRIDGEHKDGWCLACVKARVGQRACQSIEDRVGIKIEQQHDALKHGGH